MKRYQVLLSLVMVLLLAAACEQAGDEPPTPLPFEPAGTPGPQATETLPPLPTLDLPTTAPTVEVPVTPLELRPGSTGVSVEARLAPRGIARYRLAAQAGQVLSADLSLAQGLAVLVVLDANRQVLISDQPRSTQWHGTLPTAQDYYIDVRAAAGVAEVSYTLQVSLEPGP